MLENTLIFISGFILGALVFWVYGFITDKVTLARAGYGIDKGFVMWVINKFIKKKVK